MPASESSLESVLPARILSARKALGLTQQTAAEAAGVAVALWSKYECGHVTPSIGTLERMASALGVSVSDLLRVTE